MKNGNGKAFFIGKILINDIQPGCSWRRPGITLEGKQPAKTRRQVQTSLASYTLY